MIAQLFDSNFVYFATYFVFVAAFGQYIIIKRVSEWFDRLGRAFRRAKKTVYGSSNIVDVQARQVVTKKSLPRPKPLTKEEKRRMETDRQEKQLAMEMHNLTSKFHRKSTGQ